MSRNNYVISSLSQSFVNGYFRVISADLRCLWEEVGLCPLSPVTSSFPESALGLRLYPVTVSKGRSACPDITGQYQRRPVQMLWADEIFWDMVWGRSMSATPGMDGVFSE